VYIALIIRGSGNSRASPLPFDANKTDFSSNTFGGTVFALLRIYNVGAVLRGTLENNFQIS